ncbi:putative ribonucleoside-diphosphate reductase small chain B [Earliella scabrosa]|nr:putative ribonucleoside-diphosphate reductase small chain B [Earliella scabrosa]
MNSQTEAFFAIDRSRFVLFPIKYPKLWAAYKRAQASFWTAEEIDLSVDKAHWQNNLRDDDRRFLGMILAFFVGSDGIVVDNLAQRFSAEVPVPEARCFYAFQMMIENVHAEVYSRLVKELVPDVQEQKRLFTAIDDIPVVRAKADWCLRWIMDSTADFPTRLLAFAIVEGVFFSSSFAAIFWVRSQGVMPGLCHSNELISRDEGMHVEFACLLYRHLSTTVATERIHEMVAEAVQLEQHFFAEALSAPLLGMNSSLMGDYVEYVADYLLGMLGLAPLYGKDNPFPFMEGSAVGAKANFFERPVSDYVSGAVHDGWASFTHDQAQMRWDCQNRPV